MATILDIKHMNKFTGFDFRKMHEGLVVETSMFDTKGSIYVTIPELFIGTNDDRAISSQSHIDFAKVKSDNLKYRTEITHVNYVECLPIVLNGFSIGHLKPKIGNTVMVYFLNGDAKLPYYFNGHPLKQGEDIMQSSNEKFDHMEGFGYYRLIKLMADPMFGPDIYLVGSKLELLGYDVKVNPIDEIYYYDEEMCNAILTFQRRLGLTEDGEVGPVTFRMLMRYKQ